MTQPPNWNPQHRYGDWDQHSHDDHPTSAFPSAGEAVNGYPHAAAPPPIPPQATQAFVPPPVGYGIQPVGYMPVPQPKNSNTAVWVVIALLAAALVGVIGYVWLRPMIANDSASQTTTSTSTVVVPAQPAVPVQAQDGPVPAQGNVESVPAYSTRCASVFPSASFATSAVGSNVTSCEFAEEVRSAYLRQSVRNSTVTVNAYSPVTGRSYYMTCSGNTVVTCTGGNDAVVYVY